MWDFEQIERDCGVQMQPTNTITKPFCYDVKNVNDDLRSQFWNTLASSHHSLKSYLEWRKASNVKRKRDEEQEDGDDEEAEEAENRETKRKKADDG